MNAKIKNILLKLTEAGYEAYVVGGYVRDYILGNETYDVDIATSAEPKEVKEILNLSSSNDDNYGSIRFKDSLYNYDITTFRKENKYDNRKPVDYEFVSTIEEDIKRRDFTINSLYMDSDGKIHDYINGEEDIMDGIIRVVGNVSEKFSEDPLRILRSIRFASTLNFKLDPTIINYVKQNKILIRTLSFTRKKEELDYIFRNQVNLYGIELIKELDIENELEIKIPETIIKTENNYGIWAQIEVLGDYNFSTKEEELIDSIKSIIKYGIIDNIVLYQYGLYASIIAGEILGTNRSNISELYKNLPIYTMKDINIDGDEIIEILGIEPGEKIKEIIYDLEISILNNLLENNKDKIKEYILKNWR